MVHGGNCVHRPIGINSNEKQWNRKTKSEDVRMNNCMRWSWWERSDADQQEGSFIIDDERWRTSDWDEDAETMTTWKKLEKTGCEADRLAYRQQRKLANDLINKSRREHYANMIADITASPENRWSAVNELLHINYKTVLWEGVSPSHKGGPGVLLPGNSFDSTLLLTSFSSFSRKPKR